MLAFKENIADFFASWIPETIRIFAPTGAAVNSCVFWHSQIRCEIDNRLWHEKYFGRKTTENELIWLVNLVVEHFRPHIQQLLDERLSNNDGDASELAGKFDAVLKLADHEYKEDPKEDRLRQAFALEDLIADLEISDGVIAEMDERLDQGHVHIRYTSHKALPFGLKQHPREDRTETDWFEIRALGLDPSDPDQRELLQLRKAAEGLLG